MKISNNYKAKRQYKPKRGTFNSINNNIRSYRIEIYRDILIAADGSSKNYKIKNNGSAVSNIDLTTEITGTNEYNVIKAMSQNMKAKSINLEVTTANTNALHPNLLMYISNSSADLPINRTFTVNVNRASVRRLNYLLSKRVMGENYGWMDDLELPKLYVSAPEKFSADAGTIAHVKITVSLISVAKDISVIANNFVNNYIRATPAVLLTLKSQKVDYEIKNKRQVVRHKRIKKKQNTKNDENQIEEVNMPNIPSQLLEEEQPYRNVEQDITLNELQLWDKIKNEFPDMFDDDLYDCFDSPEKRDKYREKMLKKFDRIMQKVVSEHQNEARTDVQSNLKE